MTAGTRMGAQRWELRGLRYRAPGVAVVTAAVLVVAFMYIPVLVIALQSFNASSVIKFPVDSWTTHWYADAASNRLIQEAAMNSATVALVSIPISLAIGIPAAFAIDRFNFPGKAAFQRLLLVPFLLPGIVTGIGLVTVFLAADVPLSLKTVIVGHVTMLVPICTILTAASLARWDRTIEASAMDLGANEVRTFFHVTLPNLKSTIAGIVLLSVTFSLDEITRTFFLSGTDGTLPIFIWSMLRRGITPEVNALATCILVLSLTAVAVWSRLSKDVI
jgi:spermidine/putrescine transport system permease protein